MLQSHLEYCVQFLSLHFGKDAEALERVRKKFSRILPGLCSICYEEKLDKLGLFSL